MSEATGGQGAGCGIAICVLLLMALAVVFFVHEFTWTSFERGCVVERKFVLTMNDHNNTKVLHRYCPPPGQVTP